MKTIILSGGRGISLSKTNEFVSKALIIVNEMPLIYYILKHFYFYGFTEIILCVDSISESAINKFLKDKNNKPTFKALLSKLKLDVFNAGENGKTGSMLYRLKHRFVQENFIVTYNDIITDVNLSQLVQFHRAKEKILTVTGVHPTIRHGIIRHGNGLVYHYGLEEPIDTTIKGGYFVCRPEIFNYLSEDCVLENEPFQRLIQEKQAALFDHRGFWKEFDSYKNIQEMEKLFQDESPSWLIR